VSGAASAASATASIARPVLNAAGSAFHAASETAASGAGMLLAGEASSAELAGFLGLGAGTLALAVPAAAVATSAAIVGAGLAAVQLTHAAGSIFHNANAQAMPSAQASAAHAIAYGTAPVSTEELNRRPAKKRALSPGRPSHSSQPSGIMEPIRPNLIHHGPAAAAAERPNVLQPPAGRHARNVRPRTHLIQVGRPTAEEDSDVEVSGSSVPEYHPEAWWRENASAKEMRNALTQYGVNRDTFIWKDKEFLLRLLLETQRRHYGK